MNISFWHNLWLAEPAGVHPWACLPSPGCDAFKDSIFAQDLLNRAINSLEKKRVAADTLNFCECGKEQISKVSWTHYCYGYLASEKQMERAFIVAERMAA